MPDPLPRHPAASDFKRSLALAESRGLLELVAGNASHGLFITDEHGHCVYMNPAAEALTGYTLAEVEGRPLHYFIHHTRPDGSAYPLEECPVESAFLRNNRVEGEEFFVHRDGSFYPVVFTASPFEEEGRPAGTVIEVRDLREERRALETLREERAALRALYDSVPFMMGVAELDDDRTVAVSGNRAVVEFLSTRPEDLVGKTGTALGTPADFERLLAENYRRSRRDGAPVHFEYTYRLPAGPRLLSTTVAFIGTHSNGNPRFSFVVEDITERRRAAAALEGQREMFAVLARHTPACVCLISGSDLRLQEVNPAYQAIAPGKEMVGKTLDELWPEAGHDFSAVCRRVLETGEPHRASDELITIRRAPGGPVEPFYFSWSLHRVQLPGGGWGLLNTAWETTGRKRSEDALRAAHDTFRHLVENSPFGVYVVDADFRLTQVSAGAQKVFENVRPLMGRDFAEVLNVIWPEPFASEAIGIFRRTLETGEPYRAPSTIERRHDIDEVESYDWKIERVTLPDGRFGVVCHFYDLSERQRQQAALQESEERYAATYSNAPIGIVETTLDGAYLNVNEEFCRITGFTRDELLSLNLRDLTHPEDYTHNRDLFDRLVAGEFPSFQLEKRYVRKDGEVVWAEVSRTLIKDGEGRPLYVIGAILDITTRKLAEDKIRESEARYRALADAMPQIVYTCGPDGQADYVNRQWYEYTGIPDDGAQGFDWAAALHPEDFGPTLERWLESVKTGAIFETEYRIRHASGEYRWHLSRAVPSRDDAGRVIKWFGSSTDIHDRRQAQEERERLLERETELRTQAEEAGRLKDEFLATMSHELRTPLTAIIGWAGMLNGDKLDAGMTAKALATIERNARAQQRLIEDLMDVSRIITGKLRLDVQPVELAQVIEQAVESTRPAADAKDIHLRTVLDPLAGPVSGDPARLQQVIWNLLTNAVKFTPKGGRVELMLERIDSHVCVTVSDTGQGIRPEFLPYVFDRFRQQDGMTARAHGGLGLGLSIVRHLVELHGGTVRADSPGEGQGTSFRIELPLMAVRREPDGERRQPGVAAGGESPDCPVRLDGLRVLVVDDEPDARQLIALMLEECGAEVLVAANVPEALAALEGERPDALISDIGMPGEDGFALIRQVRELPAERGGQIPAAALTAYAGAEERKRVLLSGFQLHVPKPIEPAELAAVVASLAGRTTAT